MAKIKSYNGEQIGAMQPAALKKAIAAAAKADSESTAAVIAEGNGSMRFSDMREAVAAGTASEAVKHNLLCWEALRDLTCEVTRRMQYHGSLKRIGKF